MTMREGSLKPEFQDWYPAIQAGEWYDAHALVELVLEQQRSGAPRWAPQDRILSDVHFRFRGGESRARTARRSRREDARGAV